jgi:chromosome segregation ATPase
MLVKDILENARMRLGALPQRNKDQLDKVKAIAESHGLTDEVSGSVSALEDDTSKLVSYITVLEKEESRLSDKFRHWEEELNRLLAGEDYIPTAILVEPAPPAGQTAEFEAKITEMEDQLMAKDRKMKALEQQYEDIEKEYMILYHAQQKQQQKQPEI